MANNQPTRQELYDRIKASTKDAVILEEMKQLGFWKKDDDMPSLPEQLINKEAELTQELNDLLQQQRRYKNKEEALKEVRKARLEESRRKQVENKALRKQKREEKAALWKAKKEKDIIYLGEDVSKGLNNKEGNLSLLDQKGLPNVSTAEKLAESMGIKVSELRFLSYNRTISKISHYRRFYIPKKTGGKRLISTPMPRLKEAQYWILENILNKIELHNAAHGFITKKSIVTNAQPHVKAEVVINIDLKDFFPSITYPRVKGLFQKLGYSEQVATILGLICTEPDCDLIELDGETYYAAGTERFLPQGAPTSPAVTNIICKKLDARVQGIANKYKFTYTRYADDLTFSASGEAVKETKTLLAMLRKIIKEESLTLHPDKLRVLRKGARKEVTGITVNDKPSVNPKELHKFRALLFQIEKDGVAGKHWKGSPHLLPSIKGYASFVNMVDPAKGKPLMERVNAILIKHGYKHEIKHPKKQPVVPPPQPTAEEKPQSQSKKEGGDKPWWQFWWG
jgi:retron-type reverse transcriptase